MPKVVEAAQLFVTCLVDAVFPAVGEAVVDVLEACGVRVVFPPAQTCCGQPAFNAGFRAEAQQVARQWLAVFERSAAPVVAPSGSCVAMVKHGYAQLFAREPATLARAQALATRTHEFSQFLAEVVQVDPNRFARAVTAPAATAPVTYHPSCHLTRELGVRVPPLRLLQGAVGGRLTPLPHAEECCGFGGLFAVKHADISGAMLDQKLAHVRASGATTVVGCDMSCLMHLQGALQRDSAPVRCQHLAEVLAEPLAKP